MRHFCHRIQKTLFAVPLFGRRGHTFCDFTRSKKKEVKLKFKLKQLVKKKVSFENFLNLLKKSLVLQNEKKMVRNRVRSAKILFEIWQKYFLNHTDSSVSLSEQVLQLRERSKFSQMKIEDRIAHHFVGLTCFQEKFCTTFSWLAYGQK